MCKVLEEVDVKGRGDKKNKSSSCLDTPYCDIMMLDRYRSNKRS